MSRRMLLRCIIILLLSDSRVIAQNGNLDKVWIQGESIIFSTTFNGTASPSNQILTNGFIYFSLGSSNICDSQGNLVLACNGYNLFDKNLNKIEGGDTIVPKLLYEHYDGFTVAAQSSIILPFANGKYRVITPTASDSEITNFWWNHPDRGRALFDLLLYDEVDMNTNGGLGKVTKKMVPLLQGVKLSKTQMMACRHGDGKSWWLIKQASDTNMVYKFLFTEDKVYGPYIQGFAEPHFTKWDICGQAMFSKDGTKYATAIQGSREIFTADFDRCSGMLSNPKVFVAPVQLTQNPIDSTQVDSSTCGLAFSPNGRFLYTNSFFAVQQLDLQDSNPNTAWTQLSGLDTTWFEFQEYSNIYPAPDGKLYVGNWNGIGGQMSMINNPDAKGTAADFCPKCLRFPGYIDQGVTRFVAVSSPPCMPNYSLGPTNPTCYPTYVVPLAKEASFLLYPNPSYGTIEVKYNAIGKLSLYDVTGRVVGIYDLPTPNGIFSIDIRHLPSGVYQYQYITKEAQRKAGKLVIVQ